MPSTRLTIIVDKTVQDDENQWIRDNIDPSGDTFTSPLTSDGTTITHYWCSGLWSDEQLAALQDHYGPNCSTDDPQTFRESLNLSVYSPPV